MLTAAVLAVLAVLLSPPRSRTPPTAGADRLVAPARFGHDGDGTGRQHLPSRVATRLPLALQRGGHPDADLWVADFADVVAVGLDAGLDLASAALTSARSPTVAAKAPWLGGRLAASIADGEGVTLAMGYAVDRWEGPQRDVAVLLTAWRLSEELGAGAAEVTRAAAATLRSGRAARERTAAVVAGPRASMWLLTGLPLAGPAAGLLLGWGPASLYGSVPAASSAAVGGILTAIGWWWGRRLLRRAARVARTDAAPS